MVDTKRFHSKKYFMALCCCITASYTSDASQVSVSSSNYFDDSKVEELSCPGNVHNFMCITFNGKAQQIDVRWNNEPNGHHLFTVEYKSINPTNLSQWTSRSSYNYRHHDKVVLSSLLVHNNNASEGFVSLHRVNITGVDGIAGNGSATRLVLHCRNMKNNSEHGTVTESTKTLVFEGKPAHPELATCTRTSTVNSKKLIIIHLGEDYHGNREYLRHFKMTHCGEESLAHPNMTTWSFLVNSECNNYNVTLTAVNNCGEESEPEVMTCNEDDGDAERNNQVESNDPCHSEIEINNGGNHATSHYIYSVLLPLLYLYHFTHYA